MKVLALCWGSSRSEPPEMRTSTSVWHATVKERSLSLQSWPLSEVTHTCTLSFLHLFPAVMSSFTGLSVVDVTIKQRHTLPAHQAAGSCSFYSPFECAQAWCGCEEGQPTCSLRGISASQLAVIIPLPGQSEGVNPVLTVSLEGTLSNASLRQVTRLSCSVWPLALDLSVGHWPSTAGPDEDSKGDYSGCRLSKYIHGIRPWFGQRASIAKSKWGGGRGEARKEYDGGRGAASELSNATASWETMEMEWDVGGVRGREFVSAEDGWGLWSWRGCVASRRLVAEGIVSWPSVTQPIISAHTAPI